MRIPKSGHADVQLLKDPTQASQAKSDYTPGGFDFAHHLKSGGILYVDPDTHHALAQSGAQAGDWVRFTRIKGTAGQWTEVLRLGDSTYQPMQPVPSAPTPIRAEVRTQAPVAPFVAGAAAPQMQPTITHETVQQFREEQSTSAAARVQPKTAPLPRPAAETLAGALYAAVDAVLAAEEYARLKGRTLAFSSEDVRAMALSLYISASRENRS